MLAFPSSDVEFPSNKNEPRRNSEEHGHTRVNSSPTRPRDISQWPSIEKGTPSRPRPHLRSLDLASVSPPATPSYMSSTFAFAPKSAGISRTPASRGPFYAASHSDSITLAALNLNSSSAGELADDSEPNQDYVDLNDSPTSRIRPLPKSHSSTSYSLIHGESPSSTSITSKFSSLSTSPHRREFYPRSPVRAHGQGPATPPLTPSSSFASADTARSDRDEQDSELGERSPMGWYDIDSTRVVSLDEECHTRYINGIHDILAKDVETSPMRKSSYSAPAPDSPTPVRGRRVEIGTESVHRRTSSATSVSSRERPRQTSKALTPGTDHSYDETLSTSPQPPLSSRQRSFSIGTRRLHGQPYIPIPTDQPSYPGHSVHAHRTHHQHHSQLPFDRSLYAYGYPPYDFPPQFDPAFALIPASHVQHGPPPPLMGHHAFDSALAQAYASQGDCHGPPAYDMGATQLENLDDFPQGQDPSQYPSPPSRYLVRSSGLYTNRHGRKNSQNGQTKRNFAVRTNGRGSPFPTLDTQSHPPTMAPPPSVPDKNILDIDAIASGVDTRTTVMIKNIPNKMTDVDLLNFINRVSHRRIDFFYLRMDFTNGCNVGYAFVNFILPEDLLHFAQTQLGVKWNMYSSEKVLQLSYANYQGKEALVEKFRNSGIMDERPAWRPRIFHSAGPDQGKPQPFPQATHLRRKERSANNRGALFVPAPAVLGPRQHHIHSPPAYWTPGGFGHAGWVSQ